MMNSGIMARRPQLEEVLSPKELNALWERLQMMSVTAVQGPLFGGRIWLAGSGRDTFASARSLFKPRNRCGSGADSVAP